MPPMKITDVPISDPSEERNYRSYKLQFQAPQQIATFSWKIHVVSDTFVGEEVVQDLVVCVQSPIRFFNFTPFANSSKSTILRC